MSAMCGPPQDALRGLVGGLDDALGINCDVMRRSDVGRIAQYGSNRLCAVPTMCERDAHGMTQIVHRGLGREPGALQGELVALLTVRHRLRTRVATREDVYRSRCAGARPTQPQPVPGRIRYSSPRALVLRMIARRAFKSTSAQRKPRISDLRAPVSKSDAKIRANVRRCAPHRAHPTTHAAARR